MVIVSSFACMECHTDGTAYAHQDVNGVLWAREKIVLLRDLYRSSSVLNRDTTYRTAV